MKKIDTKTKTPVAKREISGKLFERVFLPWTAILILSHLVTIYIGPAYMWGVHFYHFFPAWIGWMLALATLVILIPAVGEFLYGKLSEFGSRIKVFVEKIKRPFAKSPPLAGFPRSLNIAFLLLSLFSLPIFWIFRTKFHLLGDGYFLIRRDLPGGKLHLTEWLDGFIHLMVYRVMTKLIPTWTPELTYSITSILCGALFVFLSLKLSSLLGKTGFGKVLIFFFLVSLGSIELFFGYVESYSILQVALLAYILFAFLYLSGKISILPALLVLVGSIGLHISTLVFVPSFIYLVWESRSRRGAEEVFFSSLKDAIAPKTSAKKRKVRSRKEPSKTKHMLSATVLIALILSSVGILYWVYKVATGLEKTGKGIFILPLTASPSYPFSMFSLAHISEFVNQLLLLSPMAISLIMFFLFFKIRFKEFSAGSKGEDRLVNFLIIATSFALVYLFVFNFILGSADWDLRSSPAPFFGLLGVLLFLRWEEKYKEEKLESEDAFMVSPFRGKRFKAWRLVFIWFGLFHTVPWILINAHDSRSVDRYLLIQENDPHPWDETGYNLSKIARTLKWAGLREEIQRMFQRAIKKNPYDAVSYYNLAMMYYGEQDFDQAILVLDSLLKVDPLYPKANGMMGNIYMKKKEYDKALLYLEQALPYFASSADYLYDLALTYSRTNQMKKAEDLALEIIKLRPEHVKAYHLLGSAYASLGDYESATRVWEHVLTINPDDSVAIQGLKEVEKRLKK